MSGGGRTVRTGHRFLRNECGAAALSSAIGAMFLMGIIAMAIDTGTFEYARQNLQRQLDASLMSIATNAELLREPSRAETALREDLRRKLGSAYGQEIQQAELTFEPASEGRAKEIVASLTIEPPSLFAALGLADQTAITVESAVVPPGAGKPLEIAIVIDTSTSMALTPPGENQSALNLLKQSVNEFIDDVSGPNTSISVVPFSDQVCLPDSIWKRSGQNPDWLTPPPQGVDANGTPIRWEGCVGSREKPLVARIDQATTAPWPAVERTKNTPLNLNGRWFYSNANDTRPMISLSRDTATLKATVNRLTANGWTYVPSGMIWGWNTLTPEAPFTEASQRGDARKVLLLFSDSENTRRTTTAPRGAASFGKTTTGNAQSNEEMLETCQNAKRDGIEVIVFWYQMRNSSKDYVDKLKQCASQPDYFVEADPKVRGNLAQRFGLVKNLLHEELRLSQ